MLARIGREQVVRRPQLLLGVLAPLFALRELGEDLVPVGDLGRFEDPSDKSRR